MTIRRPLTAPLTAPYVRLSTIKKNAIIIAMSGTGVPEEKGRKLDGRQKQ